MEIMEAVRELTEKEFMELIYLIYCIGKFDAISAMIQSKEFKESKMPFLRLRVKEWLEI